jgi:hypothetical protein
VEIPGRVLTPGTYEFKYAGPRTSGEVVAIYDKSGKLIETALTEPVYRNSIEDRTIVTFQRHGNGAPEAIDSWFYPDTQNGVRFLYPHRKAE